MFADLLRRLTAPAPDRLSDPDARLALGALLVRIAKSDGEYAAAEIAQIEATLNVRFGLKENETKALLRECEILEAEAPDTVRFTRAIKDAVAYEDRVGVIGALWEIVLADGVREEEEDSLMRMIAPMLGVSDQDSNSARLRVAKNQS